MLDLLRNIILFLVEWLYWPALVIAMGWMYWRTVKGREVERRIIFLLIGLAISGAVLKELILPVKDTTVVRSIFNRIENLSEGDVVLVSLDYDPSAAPELDPMSTAVTQHCFTKGIKICYMTLWGTGGAMITNTIQRVIEPQFPNAQYGIDYCNVGYKAGNEAVLRVIASDFKKTFPVDVFSKSLDSIPVMQGISACKDFDYIVAIGSGRPGIKEWVEYVAESSDIILAGGASAVSAPQLYPYYPRRLNGIMGGSKGASEYEKLLRDKYERFNEFDADATKIMGPQTVAHVMIMLFIVFANVAFFLGRKKGSATR